MNEPTVMQPPSSSVGDYVKAIWEVAGIGAASTSDVADQLSITPASVTNMFGRLREMGLVEYERYHGASLTEAGRVEALRLRTLLIGAAAPQEDRQRVHETIAAFKEVNEILRLLTMHLGPNAVLVNAEIHVVDGLNTDQIEELIEQITRACHTAGGARGGPDLHRAATSQATRARIVKVIGPEETQSLTRSRRGPRP